MAVAALALCCVALVAAGVVRGTAASSSPPAPVTDPVAAAAAAAAAPPPAAAVAAPVRATTVDIPTLGVHSRLVELGVDGAGVLVPPVSPAVAGWFTGGAVPGEPGPTVIAGHVDSRAAGPGVFFRLKDLRPGDVVSVGRSDRATARYRVTDVTVVPKDAFPTDQVYGPTPGPELRLITCGGEFDRSARRYLRNVVVSGVLIGPA